MTVSTSTGIFENASIPSQIGGKPLPISKCGLRRVLAAFDEFL